MQLGTYVTTYVLCIYVRVLVSKRIIPYYAILDVCIYLSSTWVTVTIGRVPTYYGCIHSPSVYMAIGTCCITVLDVFESASEPMGLGLYALSVPFLFGLQVPLHWCGGGVPT